MKPAWACLWGCLALAESPLKTTRPTVTRLPTVKTELAKAKDVQDDDARKLSPPELKGIVFLQSINTIEPFGTTKPMRVNLFRNEPVGVAILGRSNTLVDYELPTPTSGLISRSERFDFIPRAPEGKQDHLTIFYSNPNRSIVKNYTVIIDTTTSINPNLKSVNISPGRLDPTFRSHAYSFFGRVPDGVKSVKIDIEALNDRDTTCFIGDTKSPIVGKGSATVMMPNDGKALQVPIKCHAIDKSYSAYYLVALVPQRGGSTLLKELTPLAAEFNTPFDSLRAGPYLLDSRGAHRSNDLNWVAFRTEPVNPSATVSIEGIPISGPEFVSPYFRVPLGERRSFRVAVRTPTNPVEEEYFIHVDRRSGVPFWAQARFALKQGNLLGWLSSAVSQNGALSFMTNLKFLQFLSFTQRINNVPETWDSFAYALHAPFNLQWDVDQKFLYTKSGKSISMLRDNVTYFGARASHSLMGDGESVPKYKYWEVDSGSQELRDVLEQDVGEGLLKIKESVADQVEAVSGRVASSLNLVELDKQGKWSPAFDQGSVVAGVKASMLDKLEANSVKLSSLPTRRLLEQLVPASDADVVEIIHRIDNDHRTEVALLHYASALSFTTSALIILSAVYLIVWSVYLRHPRHGFLVLRQDFPAALHPARFWTFVLDFALVMYCQTTSGLLTIDGDVKVYFLRLSVNARHLTWFSGMMLVLVPCSFIVSGIVVLQRARHELVWSDTLLRYHDRMCHETKARYNCLDWLPLFSGLFAMEIRSVAPIVRTEKDEGDPKILFKADETPHDSPWWSSDPTDVHDHGRDVEGGYQSLVGHPRALKYDVRRDTVRVDLEETVYSRQHYDGLNSQIFKRYPEGFIGSKVYKMRNPYDYPVDLEVKIELRHLMPLMQMMDHFTIRVPRSHLQMKHVDSWNQLFGNAGRKNYWLWVCDRVSMMGIIFFANLLRKSSGWVHLLSILGVTVTLAFLYLPSAVATGASRWVQLMHETLEKKKVAKAQKVAETEELKVWPFSEKGVLSRFEVLQFEKEDRQYFGIYKVYRQLFRDPLRRINDSPFWKTRSWMTAREVLSGPVGSELHRSLLVTCLFLGNRSVNLLGNSWAWPLCWATAVSGVVCLNINSFPVFWNHLMYSCHEMMLVVRRFLVDLFNCLWHPTEFGTRCHMFCGQMSKAFSGDMHHTIAHLGAGSIIRDYRARDVCLISNDLGLHFPGKPKICNVLLPKANQSSCWERDRFLLHKTLYVNNPIGAYRRDLDHCLPLETSFQKFYTGKSDVTRLVASLQIVNHGLRCTSGHKHNKEDDSYLSLYTDPALIPEMGRVRLKRKGHGYSVRYDVAVNSLIIKGPALKSGVEYSVKSSKTPKGESDGTSVHSSSHHGKRARAEGVCTVPGFLRVAVPPGASPDLYMEIDIKRPDGDRFVVNPNETKVIYDAIGREMFVRHEKLDESVQTYEVSWTSRDAHTSKIKGEARCRATGVLCVPLESEGTPDLTEWINLKNKSTGSVVDIDPSQTDNYQFILAEYHHTGLGAVFYSMMRWFADLGYFFAGRPALRDIVEEPVPCTLVQCINPKTLEYRVDPNFHECEKVLRARIGELEAKRRSLDRSDMVNRIWPSMMTSTDFVRFWKTHGVNCIGPDGFINPLTYDHSPSHLQGQAAAIAAAQRPFCAELQRRVNSRIDTLTATLRRVKIWRVAFDDANLHNAQSERDAADWHLDASSLAHHATRLRQLKREYSNRISNFTYPMNVPGRLLCKRPNLTAQFRKWQREIERWLVTEEAIATRADSAKGVSRLQASVVDIMHALKMTIYRPEDLSAKLYRTVLHYVTGSQSIRGPPAPWRPDPLCAHTALVRMWRVTNDEPDMSLDPVWMPCSLKLTGNAIKILMPNMQDVERKFDSPHHWQHVTGHYIPLAAFQKLEAVHDPTLPAGASSNAMLSGMSGRITFRKNQRIRVDDNYVRRVEDDEFDNRIVIGDVDGNSDTYAFMIGHCVPHHAASNFPSLEQDRSIQADEVNVFPLCFRINMSHLPRWQSVITSFHMDRPHNDEFDGCVRYPTSPSITSESSIHMPEPGLMMTVSSSSSSSDTLLTVPPLPPAVSTSSETPPPPPPPKGLYKGDFMNHRYHGKGKLFDHNGSLVYDGVWANGMRWGYGVCNFRDRVGVLWRYEGNFVADEMFGKGVLELVDERELERLSKSTDAVDKMKTIRFEGQFLNKRRLPVGDFPMHADTPGIHPALLRTLFVNHPELKNKLIDDDLKSIESSIDSSGSGRHDLVIDIRRTFSATGNTGLFGMPMSEVDRQLAEAEYLPHRHRWVRSVDPNVGYANVVFGRGSRVLTGTCAYMGMMRDGMPHKQGTLYCPHCPLKYKGEWENGVPHGKGILERGHPNSVEFSSYHGYFVDGKRHGPGVQEAMNGTVYMEADWKHDVMDGPYCKVNVSDGNALPFRRYIGPMEKGLPNGRGRITWSDGLSYKGEFVKGLRHGQGQITNAMKEVVVDGMFVDDVLHGRVGKWVMSDKSTYCGMVVKGQRQGMGELHSADGKILYEGAFLKDLPHGSGTYYGLDGVYEGQFVKGQRQGKGHFVYSDSPTATKPREYLGSWKNDKQDGNGRYLAENGKDLVFQWKSGQPAPESVKKYKSGLCSKAPEVPSTYTVKECSIKQADSALWGSKRSLTKAYEISSSLGFKAWEKHTDHDAGGKADLGQFSEAAPYFDVRRETPPDRPVFSASESDAPSRTPLDRL